MSHQNLKAEAHVCCFLCVQAVPPVVNGEGGPIKSDEGSTTQIKPKRLARKRAPKAKNKRSSLEGLAPTCHTPSLCIRLRKISFQNSFVDIAPRNGL